MKNQARNKDNMTRLFLFFFTISLMLFFCLDADLAVGQTVDKLLKQARLQIRQKKLTIPANDNALKTLKQVLEIEPDNGEVPKLFEKMKSMYIRWAEQAQAQGKPSMAKIYYKRLLKIDPEDADILNRLEMLQGVRDTQGLDTERVEQEPVDLDNEQPSAAKEDQPPKVDTTKMVLIPEGQFVMGSDDIHPPDRTPAHKVFLKAFYIDTYEVTNGEMVKFLNSNGNPEGKYVRIGPESFIYKDGDKYFVKENKENYPANFVSCFGAKAYCEWAGKKLPTEAQWEKAARGTDGRRYPWGSERPSPRFLNFISFAHWKSVLKPVGSYEAGKSPYGLYDMAGNVWEWCSDWYSPRYYNDSPHDNPAGPEKGQHKVLRGGLFGQNPLYLETSYRNHNRPDLQGPYTGFRCVYEEVEKEDPESLVGYQ